MAESSSSNLLDWTITDAPPADEPLHPPAPSSPPGHPLARHSSLSIRLWLMVGSLIAVVIAGLWVFSAYNTWRTRRDVMRVATLEEKAAWAGDTRQYLQYSDDGNPDWMRTQAWLADNRQPAPAPLPGLRSSTLNELLHDQPADKETALFQAFSAASGPVPWVAKGLGISSPEAQARLDAAFKRIQPALR